MKLLLDTHVFLWFTGEPAKLSAKFLDALEDPSHEAYLSPVFVWEIVVKCQLGKLRLKEDSKTLVTRERARAGILALPLDEEDVLLLQTLPMLHRDPFDRLLMCQSLRHQMTLLTDDAIMKRYPVSLLMS